ncbi:hypothetical protein [Spartinivicinus poritis]|uniref:Uncharacterized protein n=1 Tax=Spartinivicinus poritis TaxID=2994640 RepID=A0ABT5UG34_9GAMM|nr:hypothetical protein [Spartinivicinus sp. A2-2]MDE1465334.1 hypothetical protein [Spartinivicinus sp. A2-2]
MSKLAGTTKLGERRNREVDAPKEKEKLTTVKTNRNVTTGLSPKPFRLTADDISGLQELTEEIQSMTKKNITEAKVIRGLIGMRSKLNKKKLLESIMENT